MSSAEKAKAYADSVNAKTSLGKIKWKNGLSSGSTLLNLACTGKSSVAFLPGYYYLFVGDSSSGKTFLALTCLAEAANKEFYNDYRLIYDGVEEGALMNIEKFFGKKLADRLEAPRIEKNEPIYSATIEDFYYNVDDANKQKKPFIYILDSMDGLTTSDEIELFDKNKTKYRKGGKLLGSYGDGKAKKNSTSLRRLIPDLKKSGSILIVICQTRDTMERFSFEKKTRAGGHSLRFYATLEVWASIKERIKKTIGTKKVDVGVVSQVRLKKNRINGRLDTVHIQIYPSYGIDDTGSLIDYLVDYGHWKKKGGTIKATELELEGSKAELVKEIEEKGLEKDLKLLTARVWNEIIEATTLNRKPRYE